MRTIGISWTKIKEAGVGPVARLAVIVLMLLAIPLALAAFAALLVLFGIWLLAVLAERAYLQRRELAQLVGQDPVGLTWKLIERARLNDGGRWRRRGLAFVATPLVVVVLVLLVNGAGVPSPELDECEQGRSSCRAALEAAAASAGAFQALAVVVAGTSFVLASPWLRGTRTRWTTMFLEVLLFATIQFSAPPATSLWSGAVAGLALILALDLMVSGFLILSEIVDPA